MNIFFFFVSLVNYFGIQRGFFFWLKALFYCQVSGMVEI